MKRREIVELYYAINGLIKKDEKYPTKFIYMITKNQSKLGLELDIIKTMEPKSPNGLEQKRMAILSKYITKDDNGNIIWENEENGMPKYSDMALVKEEIGKLEEEFKPELTEYKNKYEDFQKYLDEDVDILFFKTSIDNFPNSLTPKEFKTFSIFISE